jgi:hypothetical protein
VRSCFSKCQQGVQPKHIADRLPFLGEFSEFRRPPIANLLHFLAMHLRLLVKRNPEGSTLRNDIVLQHIDYLLRLLRLALQRAEQDNGTSGAHPMRCSLSTLSFSELYSLRKSQLQMASRPFYGKISLTLRLVLETLIPWV